MEYDIPLLTAFLDFARSKGDEFYSYGDIECCAFAQFMKHRTGNLWIVGSQTMCEWDNGRQDWDQPISIPEGVNDLVHGDGERNQYFSALADRIDALLAKIWV